MKATVLKTIKITQAAKVSAKGNKQVAEVCQMLGWTEDQYYTHQFEQYEVFIKFIMQGSSLEFYNKIRFSPLMRGFWNNEWIQREDEMLEMLRFHLFEGYEVNPQGELITVSAVSGAKEFCIDAYMNTHNGKLLYNEVQFIDRFEHIVTLIAKS